MSSEASTSTTMSVPDQVRSVTPDLKNLNNSASAAATGVVVNSNGAGGGVAGVRSALNDLSNKIDQVILLLQQQQQNQQNQQNQQQNQQLVHQQLTQQFEEDDLARKRLLAKTISRVLSPIENTVAAVTVFSGENSSIDKCVDRMNTLRNEYINRTCL